jgi:hypothetical protein
MAENNEGRETRRLIGEIKKASGELIRVQVQTWQGAQYIDIRVWSSQEPGAEPGPSKRGITLHVKHLSALRKLLDTAFSQFEFGEEKPKSEASGESGEGGVPF